MPQKHVKFPVAAYVSFTLLNWLKVTQDWDHWEALVNIVRWWPWLDERLLAYQEELSAVKLIT